jgi:hypothetical protein
LLVGVEVGDGSIHPRIEPNQRQDFLGRLPQTAGHETARQPLPHGALVAPSLDIEKTTSVLPDSWIHVGVATIDANRAATRAVEAREQTNQLTGSVRRRPEGDVKAALEHEIGSR